MGLPLRLRPRKPSPAANLAERPDAQAGLRFFSRERAWINEKHLALCRVPAPTFLEEKRAAWMAAELDKLGCEVEIDRAGNVIAYPERPNGKPLIALTAHLDTVLAPRTGDDIRVASDSRFLGPGISDNGAGLAALLAIAAAWRESERPESELTPVLIANVGEEGEGNLSGMRYLCRQSPLAGSIRGFVVLDGPGTDHITAHALGSRRFEVSFSGPGGHSWSDYGTGNPVHALAQAIGDFTAIPQPKAPRSSINFGLIEGGASVNSIPSEARAKLDIRSESPERMDELAELLTDAVERALAAENERVANSRKPGRVTAKIREIGSRPGGRLPENSPMLAAIRDVDAHLGIRSALDCASTDANIPLSLGLPAISIGAGGQGGGAHTSAEWFHPEGRETGLRRIYLLLRSLLES
ncbi:MAG: M20/M25/M40 family metallo-hydrolase [Bryobacteraceae bacterium]|nr:M20/M25/M40 family metallo-hydrolase [Bryobacteraceae bacterium]